MNDYTVLFYHINAISCRLEAEILTSNYPSSAFVHEVRQILEQFSRAILMCCTSTTQTTNAPAHAAMAANTLAAGLHRYSVHFLSAELNDILQQLKLAAGEEQAFADYLVREKRRLVPLLMSMRQEGEA